MLYKGGAVDCIIDEWGPLVSDVSNFGVFAMPRVLIRVSNVATEGAQVVLAHASFA